MTTVQPESDPPQRIAGGIALALGTVLTITALVNHPAETGHDLAGTFRAIAADRRVDQFVHGAVIAALVSFTFGGSVLARRLGLWRAEASGGLVAYGFGSFIMILAALIDGFVTPDIAGRFLDHMTEDANFGLSSIILVGSLIEDMTKLGIILVSAGILAWSSILVRRGGAERAAGGIGLAAALLPLVLLTHHATLSSHMLITIFAAQSLWNLSIAGLLLRGRI